MVSRPPTATAACLVLLCLIACSDQQGRGSGSDPQLWPYGSIALAEPGTWQELVRAEPSLDTARIVVTPDLQGRVWRNIRIVKGDGPDGRLELTPDSIKVDLIGAGTTSRGGPVEPFVYLLDYEGDGFYWVGRWVVLTVGTELLVEAGNWTDFSLREGRLLLLEDGVQFIPDTVETPPGLCAEYRGRLDSAGARECGPEAVRPTG